MGKLTYFRLPDLMTVASEEEQHAIDGPVEFSVTLTGVIMSYDEIVVCSNCDYPNRDDDDKCIACDKVLDNADILRFWKMVPDYSDITLEIRSLDVGPPELDI